MRIFYFLIILFFVACSDSDNDNSCIPFVFDEEKFGEQDHFGVDLLEYELNDDCLKVELGISGCSPDHRIEMMSNGYILYGEPYYSIYIDFYDYDPESCEAYLRIEREFDIQPIREKFDFTISLRMRNGGEVILIEAK